MLFPVLLSVHRGGVNYIPEVRSSKPLWLRIAQNEEKKNKDFSIKNHNYTYISPYVAMYVLHLNAKHNFGHFERGIYSSLAL